MTVKNEKNSRGTGESRIQDVGIPGEKESDEVRGMNHLRDNGTYLASTDYDLGV